ncbi:helix-turn-helix domain-containing protein [Tomitella gaofuii]|uniref:helix-turn-helix domain-containing protein n=1 Tax=Tomitella gaofuii TaxID=2760083 RepID=UPI0015F83948|nr:helix-turn-helix transcriptional regulator [Tomitella gaofuii]
MNATVEDDRAIYPEWTVGDRIKKVRGLTGMGQREFAEAIGSTAAALAAWETDRAKPRDIVAIAKRIEMLTRVPAGWILGLERESPRPDDDPDGGLAVRRRGLEPRTR